MQSITDYTRSTYQSINRSLLSGVVSEQAADLIDAVASLPALPGTTYRTFWIDNVDGFAAQMRSGSPLVFSAFTSTSRLQVVANKFNGNVKLTIQGKTGRDIARFSDAPQEMETLYLPGLQVQVTKIRVLKVAGTVVGIEAELVEL